MTVQRFAAWASAAVVTAAVVAGFVVSGSPVEQRLERRDELRVSHLHQLISAIDLYHTQHGVLPQRLDVLVDGRRLSRMPSDPVTGLAYPYQRLSAGRYRLCATFDTSSTQSGAFWSHSAGPHCYDFEAVPAGSVPIRPPTSGAPDEGTGDTVQAEPRPVR